MKESQNQGNIQDVFNFLGFGRFQFILLAFLSFCWMAESVESQVGVLVSKIAHCDLSQGSSSITKYMVTAAYAGQAIGSFIFGYISDTYGRKVGILLVATSVSVFGFLSVAAQKYWGLIILRFFVGLGLGGLHVAVTLLYEMVPSGGRHLYVCIEQVFFSIGGILISAIGYGMIPKLGPSGWRYFLIVAAAPTTIACLFYPMLLESPRWLISQNRFEDARRNIYKMYKFNKVTVNEDLINDAIPQTNQNSEPTVQVQSNAVQIEANDQNSDANQGKNQFLAKLKRQFRGCKNQNQGDKPSFKDYLKNFQNLKTFVIIVYLWFAIGMAYYGSIQVPVTISSNGREPFECDYQKREVIASNWDYINQIAQTAGEIPGQIFVAVLMFFFPRKYSFSIVAFLIGASLIVQAVVVRPEYLYASWEGKVLISFQYITRSCCLGGVCIMYIISNEVVVTGFRSYVMGLGQLGYEIGATIAPLIVIGMAQKKNPTGAFGLQAAFIIGASILVLFLPFEQSGKDLREEDANLVQAAVKREIKMSKIDKKLNPKETQI